MWKQANHQLIDTNVAWLRQALGLIGTLEDAIFATKVGSHLRHVLEFYECFLNGLESTCIDYDRRKRDFSIEQNRHRAAARIRAIIRRLEDVRQYDDDSLVAVRIEGSDSNAHLRSSVARELQSLSSHTIHHFALMAMVLKTYGIDVDPHFGVSPSTLRYEAKKAAAEAA